MISGTYISYKPITFFLFSKVVYVQSGVCALLSSCELVCQRAALKYTYIDLFENLLKKLKTHKTLFINLSRYTQYAVHIHKPVSKNSIGLTAQMLTV